MNTRADELRKNLAKIKEKIVRQEKERRDIEIALENLEKNCHHEFTLPEYCPEHHDAYTDPGDPPGTMGVDFRGPTFVPSKTIDKWRRTCKLCGKVEETTNVTKVETAAPKF